jgi:hypothetical protein
MKHHDLDFLQSELTRVSGWIQFADSKAGFVAAFYSAVLGFLISKREEIFTHMFFHHCFHVTYASLIFALFILLGVGVYFLFTTVSPRLKNTNTESSLFYFGSVGSMKPEDYLKAIDSLSEEDAHKQIVEQIHTNSVIASAKMDSIKKSIWVLVAVGVLMFLIFFL